MDIDSVRVLSPPLAPGANFIEPLILLPETRFADKSKMNDRLHADARSAPTSADANPIRDPRGPSLARLFEAQVARNPDAIAINDAATSWTYRQLNARADQLARVLHARAVGRGTIVGIAFERPFATIIAMLASVKAGAAYLPLDVSYPRARLRFMVEDAGAEIVLTDTAGMARVAGIVAAERCVNIDALDRDATTPHKLPDDGGADDLVYVMYTSGTTGRPKGALICARGIISLVTANPLLAVSASDVVAQIANIAFDAATYEIWGALLNGARLEIGARDIVLVPETLAQWIRERGVSVAFVTSALLRHVSRQAPDAFATMRTLIAGGDVVDPDAARAILVGGAPRRFLNGYGPTETTTFATIFEITHVDAGPIPIGSPLAGVETYILDRSGNPVRPGEAGQLHIGGVGLARGYVNDAELTKRAFIRHPFRADPALRLYATGDSVRSRPDGTIEFVGRTDRQVKIRGFRIEIDEVQAALRELAGVADAIVTIDEATPGEKRIVAYVVDDVRPARSVGELRAALAQRLPAYMLPGALLVVSALPLNANGKVDVAALTQTAVAPPVNAIAGIGPAGTTPGSREAALCEIIAEVIGTTVVRPHENFFDLGGHSLLAMRAVARINEHFSSAVTLRDFFAEPTVAALAQHVRRGQSARDSVWAQRGEPTIGAPRAGRPQEAIPLSTAQTRLWLLSELEPQSAAYNVPYAFRLRGRLDREALARALDGIVRRHALLRSTVTLREGEPTYRVHEPTPVPLALVTSDSEAQLKTIIAGERDRPFNLHTEFPIRVVLVRCVDTHEHVLILTIHHIATDGWSMGILKRELATLYTAERRASPAPLPPAGTYAHFAQCQREEFDSGALAKCLTYWQGELSDVPAPLDFMPLPADTTPALAAGQLRSRRLAPATQAALRAFCRAQRLTEFTALCAAFAVLLQRLTGRRDFIVGTVVANRARAEFEHTIGFFVNTLPLRVRIDGDPTFRAFLSQLNRSTLAAIDNGDVPLQHLVEIARPARVATHTPLINVMIVLQNVPDGGLRLADLEVTPVVVERTTAKFDLTLEITLGPAGEFEFAFEYRSSLFTPAAIDALLASLEAIVDATVRDPDVALSRIAAEFPSHAQRQAERSCDVRSADADTHRVRAPIAAPHNDRSVAEAEAEATAALCSIWEQLTGSTPTASDESFFNAGGHSLLAVRLMAEIEKTFGYRLPLSRFFDEPTIAGLTRALGADHAHPTATTIRSYHTGGTAQPLFFLHGSIKGGGAYSRVLVDQLGPDRPVHVIAPHGMDGEPIPATIEAMARENVRLLKQLQPRGPYLLGGYCAGGLVAFAIAQQLRAGGDEVSNVVLIDVPGVPSTLIGVATQCIDGLGALLRIDQRQRLRLTGQLARLPHHRARFASSAAKIAFVKQRLARVLRGRSQHSPATSARAPLAAWIRRTEAYVPRSYDGPITLLLTEPGVDPAIDRSGWSRLAPRTRIALIPGTHHSCITEFIATTAQAVADALHAHIDDAATSSTTEMTF
jgi:amino acid adenylation domain-containing protein